tara:strand:+ start:1111 stop:1350 length:240 start_codon:yes stop_codon:yes gene_type:complete
MTKFDNDTLIRWEGMIWNFLGQNGYGIEDVVTGKEAWNVANVVGILSEAYEDRTVIDAHIQTALEKLFPDAIFKDKKVY